MFGAINFLFTLYFWMILVRVMSSWFPQLQGSAPLRFVALYTDPYLGLFQRWIPPIGGVLDISPVIACFALQMARRLIGVVLP